MRGQQHGLVDSQVGDVEDFLVSPSMEPSRHGARTPSAQHMEASIHRLTHSLSHQLTELIGQSSLSSPSIGHPGLHGPISQMSLLSSTLSEPDPELLDGDFPDLAQSMLQYRSVGGGTHPALFPSTSMQYKAVPHHLLPLRSNSHRTADTLHHTTRNNSIIRHADASSACEPQQQPQKHSSRPSHDPDQRTSTTPSSDSDFRISPHSGASTTTHGPKSPLHCGTLLLSSTNLAAPTSMPPSPSASPNRGTDLAVSPTKPSGNAVKLREHRQKRQLRQLRLIQNITLRSGSTSGHMERPSPNRNLVQPQLLSASPLPSATPSPIALSSCPRSTSDCHEHHSHSHSNSMHGHGQGSATGHAHAHPPDLTFHPPQQQVSSDGSQRFSSHTPAGAVPHRSRGSCMISLDGSATGSLVASSQRSYVCMNDPLDPRCTAAGVVEGSECDSESGWNVELPGATLSYISQHASGGSSFLMHPDVGAISTQPRDRPSSHGGCSPKASRAASCSSAIQPSCGDATYTVSKGAPCGATQLCMDTQQPHSNQHQHPQSGRSSAPLPVTPTEVSGQGVSAGLFRREGIYSMSGTLMGQYASQLRQSSLGRLSVGETLALTQTLSPTPAMSQPQVLSRLQHTVVSNQRVNGWGEGDIDLQPTLDAAWAPVGKST